MKSCPKKNLGHSRRSGFEGARSCLIDLENGEGGGGVEAGDSRGADRSSHGAILGSGEAEVLAVGDSREAVVAGGELSAVSREGRAGCGWVRVAWM